MAWSAPMTAVANTAFTAAQFNTFLRDNLLETAPAKATTPSGYFVTTGTNSIEERVAQSQIISMSESTTSTSYTDLVTFGPSITLTTGSHALVIWGGQVGNTTSTTASSRIAMQVSGATSIAATDNQAFGHVQSPGTSARTIGTNGYLYTTLTPGTNTFTLKYRVSSGQGLFHFRKLSVLPL